MVLPTLRQLEYLRLLADQGSFSRAAEAAHVTQPTLSAGIQELEKILGSAVVDRGRSGVILTPVGEEALRRAQAILTQAEDLVEAAQSAGAPLVGRFRLGVIPTIAPFLLPKALPRLRARYPKLKLYLREDQTSRLITALKAGELDAALIALPYEVGGLETARIADDALMAALPADHRLANAGALAPEVLANDAMILLEDGHCLRDHALAACGFSPPKPGAEDMVAATSLPTLVQMVASGLGVSFLPAMAVEAGLTDRTTVSIHPLAAAQPNREIVVCWRAGSSRRAEGRLLAEAFRDA
jgi:LysR family hydrogen peroxide-inducible transcriptional activator